MDPARGLSGLTTTLEREMRILALGSSLFAIAIMLLGASARAAAAQPSGKGRSVAWGVVGNYTAEDVDAMTSRGLRLGLVEMSWSSAEPAEGRWNGSYFADVRARIARLRSSGVGVILNFGLQDAPAWLLARPNARFVNQRGTPFTQDDEANLVFATGLRRYAAAYTGKVFRELGTGFYAVRVGGLHWGELAYPYLGRGTNDYWAFDASAVAARARTPFARYVPCQGPASQAQGFVSWYLGRLVEFQNWQVRTVRSFFRGPIAVLYPSHGFASGDAALAARGNLCGTTSAEVNGELQRGIDHPRQIRGLPNLRCLAAWSTWENNASAASDVFGPALRRGILRMGENSGDDRDAASMQAAVRNALRFRLAAFLWIRLDGSEPATSTIDRFATTVGAAAAASTPSAASAARPAPAPCVANEPHGRHG